MLGVALGGVFTALGALVWFKVLIPFDRMAHLAQDMREESCGRGWYAYTPDSTGASLVSLAGSPGSG